MEFLAYIVMSFGAVLALIGIVLFARTGAEGTNTVKMFGFEFQLTGSALVIFVVGALIFLVPVLYEDTFRRHNQPGPRPVPENSERPGRTEIRSLVANHLKVKPENIDVSTPLKRQSIGYDDLDLIEIVIEIEDHYGVEIEDRDLDLEHVSIDDLAGAVDRKLLAR